MSIAANFDRVRLRIATACAEAGRAVSEVTLVAVSKTKPVEAIREAISVGQRVFGENYVQEAVAKGGLLGGSWEPHLIGPLQRNKAKAAVGLFSLIHSVDRVELAVEIDKIAAARGIVQEVLIQVNVSGEASKAGIAPDLLLPLLDQLGELPGLRLRGLMCIGRFLPEGIQSAERRAEFGALRALRDRASAHLGSPLPHLSMGMSDDFALAIAEGATLVRVGSALFGER